MINYWIIPGIIDPKKQFKAPLIAKEKLIIQRVASYTGADPFKKNKKSKIIEARQVAMYLIRKTTHLTLTGIGELFNRNHATVIHACKVVENYRETDKNFNEKFNDLFKEFEL